MAWDATTPFATKTLGTVEKLNRAHANTVLLQNGGQSFDKSVGDIVTITTTGTQNDLDISTSPRVHLRCNNATLLTINGLATPVAGQLIFIESVGAGQVDIANQAGASTAANRLINNVTASRSLAPGSGVAAYMYDDTTARWRCVLHDQGAPIAFTPTLTFGGGSTGLTFSTQTGSFILRGRTVHFTLRFTLTAKGSSTGAAAIGTLPFTSVATYYGQADAVYWAAMSGLVDGLFGYIGPSTTSITMQTGGAAASAAVSDAYHTNTSDYIMTGSYFAV